MSDKQDEKEIKVTDKRRVNAEGDLQNKVPAEEGKSTGAPEPGPDAGAQAAPGPDSLPEKEAEPAGESERLEEQRSGPLPQVTFLSHVFSLASLAMMYMGDLADMDGKSVKDIALAKQTIDLLGLLSEKTRGNLTKEEEQFLSSTLRDLRLRFVQARK
jgi:hypothetical protein